jgi:hypothetical protein
MMLEGCEFAPAFASLEGVWRVEKSFSDGSQFHGTARFERSGDSSFDFHEEGILILSTAVQLRAERRWKWQLLGRASMVVRYPEDRNLEIYHHIDMAQTSDCWKGSAEHLCGADVYCADYILKPGEIIIKHDISGPRKSLAISARHLRLPG